jgi:phenylalanyl-tRNA synthetase beta subunit
VTLDGVERKLFADDLIDSCDGQAGEPMCIGGASGGADSGVSDTTTRIYLAGSHIQCEMDTADHDYGRTSAHRFGLWVFAKGADSGNTGLALTRAALLIVAKPLPEVKSVRAPYQNLSKQSRRSAAGSVKATDAGIVGGLIGDVSGRDRRIGGVLDAL